MACIVIPYIVIADSTAPGKEDGLSTNVQWLIVVAVLLAVGLSWLLYYLYFQSSWIREKHCKKVMRAWEKRRRKSTHSPPTTGDGDTDFSGAEAQPSTGVSHAPQRRSTFGTPLSRRSRQSAPSMRPNADWNRPTGLILKRYGFHMIHCAAIANADVSIVRQILEADPKCVGQKTEDRRRARESRQAQTAIELAVRYNICAAVHSWPM